ncbi:E3 binding domain-containing protein, partial [Nitratireductor soli]|uniref:E3 binding domain-containing protein n=1 Tax=Nitratireductor soli TaxID=1670619 RepID=UPI00065E17C8
MPVEVILPKVDMDMTTGRISAWLAEEGATVKKGDVLFEIETDKAAMEIDAPASGILRNVTGKEGIDIPVGQAVAWIYEEGEAAAAKDAPSSPPVGEVSAQRTEGGGGDGAPAIVQASPPPPDQPPAAAAHPPHKGEGEVRASPLARRLAKEAGLDLSAIAGSGPKGRVVKADVEAAAKGGVAKAAAPASGQAPAPVKAP